MGSLRVGYQTVQPHHSYRKIHKMSLWKVMTMPMSQVARQASTHESAQVGKFVWGKEGFKWTAGVSEIKMTSPGAQQSFSSSIDITNHGSCTQQQHNRQQLRHWKKKYIENLNLVQNNETKFCLFCI